MRFFLIIEVYNVNDFVEEKLFSLEDFLNKYNCEKSYNALFTVWLQSL